jgi:hypothetical protein
MKNTLHAIYLRLDTTSKSLSKTALAQMILKIIYFYNAPIELTKIENELKGCLSTTVRKERIIEAVELLIKENKIAFEHNKYRVRNSRKKKIDEALNEHNIRINRIVEKFFANTKSGNTAIKKWVENVTIDFFTEYRNEWIAAKTYSIKRESNYLGLETLIDGITKKDKNIDKSDRDWLKSQYLKFFNSSDEDVASIFWDYGTCVFASTLITSSTAADKLSLESLKDSKFILDTNILMYLQLEEDNFYKSYKSLEEIFEKLNIKTCYFNVTKEEYEKSMSYKTGALLKVIQRYEEDVIDKTDDPYLKTAKSRQCIDYDDFKEFFNGLINIPRTFVDKMPLELLNGEALEDVIEKGRNNELLQEKINTIYKNKSKYISSSNGNKNHFKDDTKLVKDKKKGALIHDSGLISGAEYLRTKEKCFILTRDITVKQYGIETELRDEPPISIGLDTLIGMLAINNGGIDIDPTNFKPLFANIIKLSLIPEPNTFQVVDLARMLDVEQQIADLPSNDIIDIAKELNRSILKGVDDEKLTVQLSRRFQASKLNLKSNLDLANKEKHLEKTEKDKYVAKEAKVRDALRKEIYNDMMQKYSNKLIRNRLLWFLFVPSMAIMATLVGIYLYKHNLTDSLSSYIIGLISNVLVWFFTNLLVINPKLARTYKNSVLEINELVDKRLKEKIEN